MSDRSVATTSNSRSCAQKLRRGAITSRENLCRMDITLHIRMHNGGGPLVGKRGCQGLTNALGAGRRSFRTQFVGVIFRRMPSQPARRTSRCRTKHTGCCLQRIGLDAAHHERERSYWNIPVNGNLWEGSTPVAAFNAPSKKAAPLEYDRSTASVGREAHRLQRPTDRAGAVPLNSMGMIGLECVVACRQVGTIVA